MKNLNLILIALGCLLNISCSMDTTPSNNVAQRAIHANYDATYEEDSNQTVYKAQFRVGGSTGTTLELSSPSSVQANLVGLGRHFSILEFGTYYRNSEYGYHSSASFIFRDTENRIYRNAIEIKPITQVSFPTYAAYGAVVLSEGFLVTVTAPENIIAEDRYSVSISQTNSNGSMISFVSSSIPAINISANDLAKFQPGKVYIRVSRNRSYRLSQGSQEGGNISATYRTKTYELNAR